MDSRIPWQSFGMKQMSLDTLSHWIWQGGEFRNGHGLAGDGPSRPLKEFKIKLNMSQFYSHFLTVFMNLYNQIIGIWRKV
jgi:hypothetical protein